MGRREGCLSVSLPAIHENAECTWIGKLNLYTDKVSGITRDRQKQPGPWNKELGCLIVRAPVRIAVITIEPAGEYFLV